MELTGEFAFYCPSCENSYSGTIFQEVVRKGQSHRQSGTHNISWKRVNFSPAVQEQFGPEYRLKCHRCYQVWTFDSKNELEDFADKHERIVGHRPQEHGATETAFRNASVKEFLRRVDGEFNSGVPKSVIIDVLTPEKSFHVIEEEINRMVRRDEIYQPNGKWYKIV